jgi:hypothetical protein
MSAKGVFIFSIYHKALRNFLGWISGSVSLRCMTPRKSRAGQGAGALQSQIMS